MKAFQIFLGCTLILTTIQLGEKIPVIGIISSAEDYPNFSLIKITYPAFVETANATVIPIPWDIEETKLIALLQQVNGVLFLGGGDILLQTENQTGENEPTPFLKRLQFVYEFILSQNEEGNIYPLYAICLGMEALAMITTSDYYVLDRYNHSGVLSEIHFTAEAQYSILYSYFDDTLFNFLEQTRAMYFNHEWGLNLTFPEIFNVTFGSDKYMITGITFDNNEKGFISSAEHRSFPIMMEMFHSERILYEYVNNQSAHDERAALAARALAEAFVSQARKNRNNFEIEGLAEKFRIENFPTAEVGIYGLHYIVNKTSLDEIWDSEKRKIGSDGSVSVFMIVLLMAIFFYLQKLKTAQKSDDIEIGVRYVELKVRKVQNFY